MELIQDSKKLSRDLATHKKAGKTRAERTHVLACSVLWHLREHGNFNMIPKLFDSLGPTENPRELVYWFGQFTENLKVNAADYTVAKRDQEAPWSVDLDGAMATPFWELKRVRDNREFDPVKDASTVVSFLKRHAKEAEEAGSTELAKAYAKMAESAEYMKTRSQMKVVQGKVVEA